VEACAQLARQIERLRGVDRDGDGATTRTPGAAGRLSGGRGMPEQGRRGRARGREGLLHERPDRGCGAPSGQDRRRGLMFAQERAGEHGVERVQRVQPCLVRPRPYPSAGSRWGVRRCRPRLDRRFGIPSRGPHVSSGGALFGSLSAGSPLNAPPLGWSPGHRSRTVHSRTGSHPAGDRPRHPNPRASPYAGRHSADIAPQAHGAGDGRPCRQGA
jgi:hypothetical protein